MTKETKEKKPLTLKEAYDQAPKILQQHIKRVEAEKNTLKAKIKQAVNLFLE